MMDALTVDRIHFAFTASFHYLFPQLTMGLSLLIVILKTIAIRAGDEHYNEAARFWPASSVSTSSSARSLEFRWSSSLAPTGRRSRGPRAA
jgi:Cytochrome bd terminal oxidase subunit I